MGFEGTCCIFYLEDGIRSHICILLNNIPPVNRMWPNDLVLGQKLKEFPFFFFFGVFLTPDGCMCPKEESERYIRDIRDARNSE
jgi:hypothetical protein